MTAVPGTGFVDRGDQRLPIRFASEQIRVTLRAGEAAGELGRLIVDGLYVLRNQTEATQVSTMFYPIPVDADHPFPSQIKVTGARTKTRAGGILWRLHLPPRQESAVHVRYEQSCRTPSARYVLTTTGRWGEALEDATYEVRWPRVWRDVRVSYDGDLTTEGDQRVLRFTKQDFLPERDLVLTWSPTTHLP